MRLFIAVNFNEQTKDKIVSVQNRLREHGRGNFSFRENLHLTLVFIGEVQRQQVESVKKAMEQVQIPKMKLTFDRTGCFRRNGSDTWWIGLRKNDALYKMQRELTAALREAGFDIENRPYKPHLTIARKVVLRDRLDQDTLLGSQFSTEADTISLMLSERINGKLTYSELYKVSTEDQLKE